MDNLKNPGFWAVCIGLLAHLLAWVREKERVRSRQENQQVEIDEIWEVMERKADCYLKHGALEKAVHEATEKNANDIQGMRSSFDAEISRLSKVFCKQLDELKVLIIQMDSKREAARDENQLTREKLNEDMSKIRETIEVIKAKLD